MPDPTNVMISSTSIDLPEHREKVRSACEEQKMLPIGMEALPADDAQAVPVSFGLVDQSKIYLGIFGWRYGFIPPGENISITEMEYDRASKRRIKRFIFMMHDEHPITGPDVETGAGADKLRKLKERLQARHTIKYFKSADELRGHVLITLSQYTQRNLIDSQYVPDIPLPPEPYIAHPDFDFQSQAFTGRQEESNALTEWVAKKARILNIVAAGGMGKSILAWKWFQRDAPFEMPKLAGRVWWSFDNKDTFDDFIKCTLAYVSKQPLESIHAIAPEDRQTQLLDILKSRRFLIVLDSFERNLIAYARAKTSDLVDSDSQQQAAGEIAKQRGLPENAAHSFIGQTLLRGINDQQVASFMSRLAEVRASRILITTRLYPREMQRDSTKKELARCKALFLKGLNDDDAVNLWRQSDGSGSRETLLSLFYTFENYPTLIYALAKKIARYRRVSENIDRWRQDYPDFDFVSGV